MYAPPMPGAKAIIATCAAAVTPAAHVRRKSAQPASNATSTASGARIDGRCVTTRSGSSPGDLRDEREEAVPERKRVAGMQAAVGELRDAVEREVVELEELPGAGEMEQPVALHDGAATHRSTPTIAPQKSAHAAARNASPRSGQRRSDGATSAASGDDDEQDERQGQRGAERERDRQRAEHDDERPGERGRDAAHAERRARGASPARGRRPSRTRA